MLGLVCVGLGLKDDIPDDPVCAHMFGTRFWRPPKLCTLEGTVDFNVYRTNDKGKTTIEGANIATLSSLIRMGDNHWGAFLVEDKAVIQNLILAIVIDDRYNAEDGV